MEKSAQKTAGKMKSGNQVMGYQPSVMYGRYTKTLTEFARRRATQVREDEQARQEEKQRSRELNQTYRGKWSGRIYRVTSFIWQNTFAKIGEDWVFLALLGIIMALISYIMDYGVTLCGQARRWIYAEAAAHMVVKYLAWVSVSVALVFFSVGFTNFVAPQAIGSGIPEMKTILRGVALKEYLTFRTGVAKVVALTTALGSGMPLGKEGPLVHIASIVATMMSKMITSFKGIYENESRNSEMLAAACAVGLAVNFAAPIGGVLFSIEVTSVYFAIRNYWRGFFSAVFGALMYRLLAYWSRREETLTATFNTDFRVDFPYDPHELFIFVLMGAFGGLAGSTFILCHRRYVLFMRKNKRISTFLKKNRFIYPGIVSVFIATLYFPPGLGQYLLTTLTTRQQIVSLFANFSFLEEELLPEQAEIVDPWGRTSSTLFVTLGLYMVATFFFTILASTIPVPHGSLIPIFRMGAAFGRMIGEAMHLWFPDGIRIGSAISPIIPGGYAIVGAAAFSAGVTHSISICIVICEMTGHIRHIIPIMIAVLVSNAISSLLQPSFYDSIIMIKKLPYLPDITSSSSAAYNIFVEDLMLRNIKFIWNGMTYKQLKQIIREGRRVRAFPLVDNPNSMILLGSVQRSELIRLITRHIGRERRLTIAAKRPLHQSNSSALNILSLGETMCIAEESDDVVEQTDLPSLLKLGSHINPEPFPLPSVASSKASQEAIETTPSKRDSKSEGKLIRGEGSVIRKTIGTIMRKSSTMIDLTKTAFGAVGQNLVNLEHAAYKKMTAHSRTPVIDMTPEEQEEWEEREMLKQVDFQTSHIDPAPFQLVERTSLLKVHSMFSLLGVNHAYVTTIGQLIGVVSLKELRKAIEDVNSGTLRSNLTLDTTSSSDVPTGSPGAPADVERGRREGDSDTESESEMDAMDFFGPGNSRVVSRHQRKDRSERVETLTSSESSASIADASVATSNDVISEESVESSNDISTIESSENLVSSIRRNDSQSDFLSFTASRAAVHCENETSDIVKQ